MAPERLLSLSPSVPLRPPLRSHADLRSGLNKGHPTTTIPKAVRPSNKKGVKT